MDNIIWQSKRVLTSARNSPQHQVLCTLDATFDRSLWSTQGRQTGGVQGRVFKCAKDGDIICSFPPCQPVHRSVVPSTVTLEMSCCFVMASVWAGEMKPASCNGGCVGGTTKDILQQPPATLSLEEVAISGSAPDTLVTTAIHTRKHRIPSDLRS